MSRRLTADDKKQLLELSDEEMISRAAHLVGEETDDFNEGAVAGLLLAIEIINDSPDGQIGKAAGMALMGAVGAYIKAIKFWR